MSYTADITIVLDRSGSMNSIKDDTIGGFNTFLEEQKKLNDDDLLTLVQFDNEYEIIHNAVPLKEIEPLTNKTFIPRGSTALLDALGRTINSTGARLAAMKEEDRPDKVIFVIITDGHENASREFKHENVMEMINHQSEKYSWDFIYLGANQDAIDVGTKLGIGAGSSMTYASTSVGTHAGWKGFASSVTRRKLASKRGDDSKKAGAFTKEERDEAAK